MAFSIKNIFGDPNKKLLRKYEPVIGLVNAFEASTSTLSDEALRAKTTEFKDRISKGESLDSIMNEAFAVVREASKRVSGQRHFDVQLLGGAILHSTAIMNALLMKPSLLADPIVHDQVQMHVNGVGIAIIVVVIATTGITTADVLRRQSS
jgi:hypothetical protein